jgi:hypothetical protein
VLRLTKPPAMTFGSNFIVGGHHYQGRHFLLWLGTGVKVTTSQVRNFLLTIISRDAGVTEASLEQNDIQLTNPVIVTDTFLPLALARPDKPD